MCLIKQLIAVSEWGFSCCQAQRDIEGTTKLPSWEQENQLSLSLWMDGSYVTWVLNLMSLQACLEQVVPKHVPRNKAIIVTINVCSKWLHDHRPELHWAAASTGPVIPAKKTHNKLLRCSFLHKIILILDIWEFSFLSF